MRVLGIDVSHYQGEVNWLSVAGSPAKFAFAKATEGTTYLDPWFEKNWSRIEEAGLYRGAYHFGRPGGDPESQAAHFASVVGPRGARDLPPVLDLEVADRHSASDVLEWARAFTLRAEALFGRKLIVYTGAFWRGPMKNPKDAFFGARALWLAAYIAKPLIPASWSRWTFWQYTEGQHNGPVAIPGVPPCDQNHFDGTLADLEALCSEAAPLPEPAPAPTGTEWPGTFFVWPRKPALSTPAVKLWQERLTQCGYTVACDGVYGPKSKRACMAFQRDHGLVADGIVGRATWAAAFAQ